MIGGDAGAAAGGALGGSAGAAYEEKKVSTKTTSNYIKKEALISLRASFYLFLKDENLTHHCA